jgi:ribosomal protein S18 acetylase RimI-like enzyme
VTTSIRPAGGADLPALAHVFAAAWQSGYRDVVPADVLAAMTETAALDLLTDAFDEPTLRTDVALDHAGKIIGFTRYGPDRERPGPAHGYLAALYVHPSASASGVGRALLDHALGALREDGRDDVTLWVFTANTRARTLYERAGFRADGATITNPRWRTPQLRYRRLPPGSD